MNRENVKVLIIDDEPMIRRTIADYLSDSGYIVYEAESGSQGLEKVREYNPGVVLLDIHMPGMNGIEVLVKIKTEFPDTAVIIVSGAGKMQDAIEGLRAGAWDFITKPIEDMAVIEYSVKKCLERAELIIRNREYEKNLETLVQKKTEALRESEEKYRALYNNSKDGYMILDPEGTFLNANPSTLEIFGCKDEEEFARYGPVDLSPEVQPDGVSSAVKARQMIAIAMEKGSHFFEWKHKRTDEEEFFATVLLSRMKLKDKTVLMATVRDVTDSKRIEEQLRQAQKMEIVGTLAGGLAHDFNNVLGGIIGPLSIIEYILQKKGKIDIKKLEYYLQAMSESSNRAADMVKQLLTLSRKQELALAPVDLNLTIKHVMKICASTFDKSVKLAPVYPEKPSMVSADPTQIEQVLLNFCVNAGHAMTIMRKKNAAWGGILTVTIEKIFADKYFCQVHPEAEERDYWLISVKDTGVGMDENTISKIFNPFFTTKETDQGTGLGLSMVYNTVKQHAGFIDVYSQKGLGSTFNTYLPVLERGAAAAELMRKKKTIPKGEGLILVVDDEEIMCDMAKAILNECGYKTIFAENGRLGVEIFKKQHKEIKAVLLDMSMPEMSGKEAFIKMKEIQPNVKVLLASGFRLDKRVDEVLKLGVKDFIQKPYTLEKLAAAVDRVVNPR